ncbi:MAG: hypothetical protein H7A37_06350 [Chlamydiales bacterium]|nr:hypothetical protein [Chlamydiia bacterium]MCP5507902.1 hypothetical protein [Chlamydiales bacterium]
MADLFVDPNKYDSVGFSKPLEQCDSIDEIDRRIYQIDSLFRKFELGDGIKGVLEDFAREAPESSIKVSEAVKNLFGNSDLATKKKTVALVNEWLIKQVSSTLDNMAKGIEDITDPTMSGKRSFRGTKSRPSQTLIQAGDVWLQLMNPDPETTFGTGGKSTRNVG